MYTDSYCNSAFCCTSMELNDYYYYYYYYYHRKVLLSSFHLNGHTLGFHSQTQKLEPPYQCNKQYHRNVLLNSFHLNGHTLGFDLQT